MSNIFGIATTPNFHVWMSNTSCDWSSRWRWHEVQISQSSNNQFVACFILFHFHKLWKNNMKTRFLFIYLPGSRTMDSENVQHCHHPSLGYENSKLENGEVDMFDPTGSISLNQTIRLMITSLDGLISSWVDKRLAKRNKISNTSKWRTCPKL